jgi:DNA-binding MarR family transcriptional regulator
MLEFEYNEQKKGPSDLRRGPTAEASNSTMTESELDDGLRRAAAQQRLVAERALADLDLTPAQFVVLRIVSEHPGTSAADVARLERLTPPTLSVIVGNLLRKKALDKRPHPENARIQQLSTTALGEGLVRDGLARLAAPRRRMRGTLTEDAETVVKQWLRDIAKPGS